MAAQDFCGGAYQPVCSTATCTSWSCLPAWLGGGCSCTGVSTTFYCDSNRFNNTLGICVPCGAQGQTACGAAPRCEAGTVENVLGVCASCGGHNELPCGGGGCDPGHHIDLGLCRACGGLGESMCHVGPPCQAGLEANTFFVCEPCGEKDQPDCGTNEAGCQGQCGSCNHRYLESDFLGVCRSCGGDGESSCNTSAYPRCKPGLAANFLERCVPCGAEGQIVCDEGCNRGLTGVFGFCRACGGSGQISCAPYAGPACADRLNLLGLPGVGICTPCGGPNLPSCADGSPCDNGLNVVAGLCVAVECGGPGEVICTGEPGCDSWTNAIGLPGLGVCTACGGDLEPFCFSGPECRRGFDNTLGICTPAPTIPEPDCDCTAEPDLTPPGAPIWGFADLHAHQFANLGFGGLQFWGSPFDADGISFALPSCGFSQELNAVKPNGEFVLRIPTLGTPVHGPLHSSDLFGGLAGSPLGLPTTGAPSFGGWPRWNSPDHQRMYYRWLERAYRAGQKLMVMQAVNNEISCSTADLQPGFGCGDMPSVDRQIQAAKDLERYIDDQHGGPGRGWYRIVYSAAEARQVIENGKMAVILGIEVDGLFDCQTGACTAQDIDRELVRYHAMGVRHAYPVHMFDNDFGGAAVQSAGFSAANAAATGHPFLTYDCRADGFTYRMIPEIDSDPLGALLFQRLPDLLGIPSPNQADCNALGLTPLGEYLLRRMIDLKMFIDVDHLSFRGVNRALEVAEEERYPLLASHIWFADQHGNEDHNRQEKSERRWTQSQVERLRNLGGAIGVILYPKRADRTTTFERSGAPVVPNDCGSSSREWAQRYLKAVELMSGGPNILGVALGSDFNGMTQSLAPRFGPDACAGEAPGPDGQTNPVAYPFAAQGKAGQFFQLATGGRLFDYNTDGLAHVGLIPDFIEDLKQSGLGEADLTPLFRSVEKVVQTWERIDRRGTVPPTTVVSLDPPAGAAGWHAGTVRVTLRATAAAGSGAIARVVAAGSGAQTLGSIETAADSLTLDVTADGVTDVTFHAEDSLGNVESEQRLVVRIDRLPPAIDVAITPDPNAAGWHTGDVTVHLTARDEASGPGACDGPFVLTGEGDGLSVQGICTDAAGNTATAEVTSIRIDRTPPRISARREPAANERGWNNAGVTLDYLCEDDLSGIASCTGPQTVIEEGTNLSRAGAATDAAGNTTTLEVGGINIDRTPPQVAAEQAPPPNTHGWNNTDVTVRFACADALSGVTSCSGPQLMAEEGSDLSRIGMATDAAGNAATLIVGGINIDRTAPEGVMQFDPATCNLAVSGNDLLAGMPGGLVAPSDAGSAGPLQGQPATGQHDRRDSRQTYAVTDRAGNVLSLVVQVQPQRPRGCRDANRLEATLMEWSAGADTPAAAIPNRLQYAWTARRTGGLQTLAQLAGVNGEGPPDLAVAKFDARSGTTLLWELGAQKPDRRDGLVLLRLVARSSSLTVDSK